MSEFIHHITLSDGRDVTIYPDRLVQKGRQANIVEGIITVERQPVVVKLSQLFQRGYSEGDGISDKSRLLHEADVLHRLHGVYGIPYFFGVGQCMVSEHQERIALVMQKIAGLNLEQRRIQVQRRLTPQQAYEFLRAAAKIFERVHALNIIHCDIKLSNFMLTKRDELYVVDWGAAQQLYVEGKNFVRPETVIGTVQYISYEHITGKQIDHRADIYSLGAVTAVLLYGSVITQRYKIDSDGQQSERSTNDIAQAIAAGETLKYHLMPKSADPIEQQLQHVIRQMTIPDREKRIQSMTQVQQLLS